MATRIELTLTAASDDIAKVSEDLIWQIKYHLADLKLESISVNKEYQLYIPIDEDKKLAEE